jgi:hypothetical protein
MVLLDNEGNDLDDISVCSNEMGLRVLGDPEMSLSPTFANCSEMPVQG